MDANKVLELATDVSSAAVDALRDGDPARELATAAVWLMRAARALYRDDLRNAADWIYLARCALGRADSALLSSLIERVERESANEVLQ